MLASLRLTDVLADIASWSEAGVPRADDIAAVFAGNAFIKQASRTAFAGNNNKWTLALLTKHWSDVYFQVIALRCHNLVTKHSVSHFSRMVSQISMDHVPGGSGHWHKLVDALFKKYRGMDYAEDSNSALNFLRGVLVSPVGGPDSIFSASVKQNARH